MRLLLMCLLVSCGTAFGQPPACPHLGIPALQTAPGCPDGACPLEWQPQASAAPRSIAAAVRVRAGRGCGSGSVVGYHRGGSLVMTNAHVSGTRIGSPVEVDCVVDGLRVTRSGEVIMSAYSNQSLTDWAIVFLPGFSGIEPVRMSKENPRGSHSTTGSPRCVWPLQTFDIRTVNVADDSPLWRWLDNSIPGQSGSAVCERQSGVQHGLTTWTWGGFGAGQQTSWIWRNVKNKSVIGPPRLFGLEDISTPVWYNACNKTPVVIEVGFFAQSDLSELPIWEDGDQPTPPAPGACLSESEKEIIAAAISIMQRQIQ